jgi:hypothetical protein
VVTERATFLEWLAAFAGLLDARAARLLGLLEEKPRTLDELAAIRLLYPPDFEALWVEDAERAIRKLIHSVHARGPRARRGGRGGGSRWLVMRAPAGYRPSYN